MKTMQMLLLMTALVLGSRAHAQYTDASIRHYMARLSSMAAGRSLNESELAQIKEKRQAAVGLIVGQWMNDGFFPESARMMVEAQLSTSGTTADVNFNLPGNLALHLVKNDLPYSGILTAEYCIGDDGQKRACDTGAPYTAGVLTTRAYMVKNQSRFNLRRAGRMLKEFACREYPMETEIQVPLKAELLIPMFAVVKGDEKSAFGNGTACYSCHSQFGAHAQFFVKFDSFGNYKPEATGLQGTGKELGRSTDTLMTSHMIDPAMAASEKSQMFGSSAQNLRDGAVILAESDLFVECAIRNVLKHYLRMPDSEAKAVPGALVKAIAAKVRAKSGTNVKATFKDIMRETFTHPSVIDAVLTATAGK